MSIVEYGKGGLAWGGATLNMLLARLRPLPPLAETDLSGKQIIVTGANSGRLP